MTFQFVGLPPGVDGMALVNELVTIGLCVLPVLLPFIGWAVYKKIMRKV
jgi:hypothetical protein